jgi:hypothetical protein
MECRPSTRWSRRGRSRRFEGSCTSTRRGVVAARTSRRCPAGGWTPVVSTRCQGRDGEPATGPTHTASRAGSAPATAAVLTTTRSFKTSIDRGCPPGALLAHAAPVPRRPGRWGRPRPAGRARTAVAGAERPCAVRGGGRGGRLRDSRAAARRLGVRLSVLADVTESWAGVVGDQEPVRHGHQVRRGGGLEHLSQGAVGDPVTVAVVQTPGTLSGPSLVPDSALQATRTRPSWAATAVGPPAAMISTPWRPGLQREQGHGYGHHRWCRPGRDPRWSPTPAVASAASAQVLMVRHLHRGHPSRPRTVPP